MDFLICMLQLVICKDIDFFNKKSDPLIENHFCFTFKIDYLFLDEASDNFTVIYCVDFDEIDAAVQVCDINN